MTREEMKQRGLEIIKDEMEILKSPYIVEERLALKIKGKIEMLYELGLIKSSEVVELKGKVEMLLNDK